MSRTTLLHAGLFQVTWFACVVGGPNDSVLWGAAALGTMLWFSARMDTLGADLALAGLGAGIGFVLDSVWIYAGVLDYHGATFAPTWIVMLWVGVGMSLNHSLSVFQKRPLLGGLLAGGCAPLSYLGGERLGGVVVPEPWLLGIVCAAWFVVFAAGFYGAGRIAHRRGSRIVEPGLGPQVR